MVVKIVILTEPLNSYPLAIKTENSLHFTIWSWLEFMTNNSLSVDIESGNIFYQNFNNSENLQFSYCTTEWSDSQSLKDCHTITVLNIMYKSFCHRFHLTISKNLICIPIRMQNIFYRFNDSIKMSGGKRQTIKHSLEVKNSIGLKKIEEKYQ